MRAMLSYFLLASLALVQLPALAAWGDVSYDPSPALFDLDKAAQFDGFGLITSLTIGLSNLNPAVVNFENEYANGQQLNDWIPLGGTAARFGFGSDRSHIQWQSSIGQVDAASTQFGLYHPHGTYGNAPGVIDSPRNYVADHFFLTESTQTASSPSAYFAIQFQSPVSFVSFAMINQTGQAGGPANLTLWRGDRLLDAVQIVGNLTTSRPDTVDGDFSYFIGSGPVDSVAPHPLPTFDFVVLGLAGINGAVGFDNFTVGIAPIPEPETYGMFLAGLGLVVLRARRRGATTATASNPTATPSA